MENNSILIVIGNLSMGGAERHLLRVMPRLKKQGLDISIYVTNERDLLANDMEREGVKVYSPPLSEKLKRLPKIFRPIIYFISLINLIFLLIRKKPKVLHCYLPGAYLLGGVAAIIARSSCLVMSRRIVYDDLYRQSFIFKFEKWMHRHLKFALGCSRDTVNELIDEGIPKEKVGLIYNGIDMSRYKDLIDRQAARKRLSIPEDTLVITILANLYDRKGHKDLLNALALIKDHLPKGWQLLSMGRDGGERAALEEKTKVLGLQENIQWLGLRMDSQEILAAADFGVMSSYEEGFSNALLESMAIGLPMVVTDISGNNEAIKDGYNGRLVPTHNPTLFSKAILELAGSSDTRNKMSRNTIERVKQYFTLEKVIKNYSKFYTSIIDESYEMALDLDQIRDC